ncbi:FMN-binding protein [Lactobacillus amylolyticus]|uniref:FMN-binding protein n=1 Tax=Lactobacillus amylolyticus TaxID=83683 RepID=UPI0024910BAF|nr:FMN-binding protein [Lactobacillus amylolyticus]
MSKYQKGTYLSKAKGHSSDVDVKVELNDDAITDVDIKIEGESESRTKGITSKLKQQILSKQNADIDAVSGATETSNAVRRALSACLNQAMGKTEQEKKPLKDGTYRESTLSYSTTDPMVGEVEIKDNQIKDVKIVSEGDSKTSQWFGVAQNKLIPRLIKEQSLDVDAITGASASSGAIKTITEKAIVDAGGNADEWHTPVVKKHDVKELTGFDVIVVGLGGSGILSYCAAAKSGAKVFGLEAAGEIGGNTISTCGPMIVNSKNLSQKYNDGKDNIDAKDLYQTWMKYVGNDTKEKVIRKAIDEDGEAIDYYMDNFGFSFGSPVFGAPAGFLPSFFLPSFVRRDWTKEWIAYTAKNNKWYTTGPDHADQYHNALNKAKAMNQKNDYQLELRAEKMLTDDKGNAIGVQAQSYDGTTYKIYGKAIILASGGFIGNAKMMKDVYGAACHVFGSAVAKGVGIKMGQSVGGNTYALKTLPMIHISQVPHIIRDDSLTPDQKAILSAIATTSDAKQIDENGHRLGSTDESGTTNSELTVGIAYAPGFHYYNAYSADEIEKMKTQGLSEATSKISIFALGQGGKVPAAGTPISDIDKIVEETIKHNDAWKGTPRQLAEQLGLDEAELTKSLGDADQIYYLFEDAAYAYATCGGLDVDENMNVLKENGEVIKNVFAVGQDSEGVENKDNEAYTPWGGQAQAWTFVSGKIAGENAAKLSK